MARGLTALRAALGAVGGVTDALQQREVLKEKQKRDQEAAEREELALYLQSGFRIGPMGQALSTVEREQAAPGRAPAPTTLAVPETRSTRPALASEYGVQPPSVPPRSSSLEAPAKAASAPAARPTVQRPFRGQTINLIAPESQEEKDARELVNYEQKLLVEQKATLAKEQAERDAQEKKFAADVERLRKSGIPEKTAVTALMMGGKYNDLFMSPDKQAELALRRQELSLDKEKFEFDKTKVNAEGAKKKAGEEVVPLPSIIESVNYFSSLKPGDLRKINPTGVMLANTGQQQGGFTEVGLVGGGSMLGVMGDQEKRYAQRAGSIADAVARASEVGVLTNFDINRFRSQIMFSPGDSEQLKQEKLNRANAWGLWLANNKKALDEGKLDRISKTPESVSGYQLSAPGGSRPPLSSFQR